jgi:isopenicillin N synthase-like dioxygenase
MLRHLLARSISHKVVYPIVINYNDLVEMKDLSQQIEAGYGPDGLGLIAVQGIPDYQQKREKLLPLARKLALLPQKYTKELEVPESNYNVGWSHGVEKFLGKNDYSKGSFYVNPTVDEPEHKGGVYYPNVWPRQALPELEFALKDLAGEIVRVGKLIARHVDRYAVKKVKGYPEGLLESIITDSKCHNSRLLHYYPSTSSKAPWCGWHNDLGALTGLTCSLYLRESTGEAVSMTELSDKRTGLFVMNRYDEIVKVGVSPHLLAFQIGEIAQILTGGIVQATPHCVMNASNKPDISRNTFAVFMQPGSRFNLNCYGNKENVFINHKEVPSLQSRWQDGMQFGEFHKNTSKAFL